MPVLSLVLLGVLGTSAGIQLLVQARRVGSSRIRIAGPPQFVGALLVAAAFAAVSAGAVLDLSGGLAPLDAMDGTVCHLAGIALWVAGAALARSAQLNMGPSWRIGVDESERPILVVSGPFQLVRNPIYTGLFAMFAGWALLDPNIVSIAGLPLAIVGFEVIVRALEEPYLLRLGGDAYLTYASRTGRFVPAIGRGIAGTQPPGSGRATGRAAPPRSPS
jgi:protein-S-isoprenylcysteine O-methyltransferase Ste14